VVSTTGNARGDLIQLNFPLLKPKLSDHQKLETMVHEYHVTREELDEWLVDGEKICLAKSRDLGAVPHVRQIFGGLYERCLRYHVAKETDKTGSEIEICHRDIQGMWDEGHARDVLGDWWRAGPKLPHPVWCLDEAKSLQSEEEEGAPSQSGGSVSSPHDCFTSVL
jgi:hypothetical protein